MVGDPTDIPIDTSDIPFDVLEGWEPPRQYLRNTVDEVDGIEYEVHNGIGEPTHFKTASATENKGLFRRGQPLRRQKAGIQVPGIGENAQSKRAKRTADQIAIPNDAQASPFHIIRQLVHEIGDNDDSAAVLDAQEDS